MKSSVRFVAYVFRKFEQTHKEICVYDLIVHEDCRRQGVAISLIEALKNHRHRIGTHLVMVLADLDDAPAVVLYSKLE